MNFYERIKPITETLTTGEPPTFSRKIQLYINGIYAKLQHTEFALQNIIILKNLPDSYTLPTDDNYAVQEGIHFYTDSFFAFLYSSLDVTAQVINQKLRLNIDEKRVS